MDRGSDRRPPIPPEDRYGSSRGQSYRPNRSPPPPRGGYRPRSPPPRGYNSADTYAPGRGPLPRHRSRSPPFRRRSRSPPPFRGRDGDAMRPRPRSPTARGFDRGRDMGYRGPPPRDMRDGPRFRDRSPPLPARLPNDRSPLPAKRSRDVSPTSSRGRFSPPPAKRERLVSPARSRYSDHSGARERSPIRHRQSPMRDRRFSPPRGLGRDYQPGHRSPLRTAERVDPRAIDNWRRRSPSPRRPEGRSGTDSGRDSGQTSRRPSPPVHPSRLAVIPQDDIPTTRPPPQVQTPKPRSPPRRPISPLPKEKDISSRPSAVPPMETQERQPPSGPASQGVSKSSADMVPTAPRPPPSGPKPSVVVPPSAPRAAATPIPAAPRGEMPGGPRGGRGGGYAPSPYRGRGGYPSGGREYDSPTGPPSGPRNAGAPSGPFRSPSTPTAPTHPRSQRFPPTGPSHATSPALSGRKISHPHLASLPPLLDEGKKLPDLFDRSNLEKLERQTEEIRKVLEEKQLKKRRGLREWEKAENEVKLAELRASLAEESLIAISGGGVGAATF
ncbi:hypothetical protein K461DRAFT_91850 [Myriangium duriaei CBS 260.36]|uniref:Serine/arginine repetitive matrix protein 1 n=1 Tax=Myriangium duriaei CBS 260.36 TaxID=1168546 RepID=A0A9P4J8T0_9PEZI|nr:hypothetical protein K461DRAFT_91850 [Myriangium duriaei CBS 260.36]